MPRLLVKSPGPPGLALELKSGAYRIGRGMGNDFQIDHPSVSTAHCELTLLSGSLLVRDLGSTNGTFIDRQPVHEGPLLFGQILEVGIIEFILEEPLRISAAFHHSGDGMAALSGARDLARCCRHADDQASFACPKCQQLFCSGCVRGLSRMDGSRVRLCPECACECERIGPVSEVEKAAESAEASSRARHGPADLQGPLRTGLIPHLAYWLKTRLVDGLLLQRRQLMQVQDMAARQAVDFEKRLADIDFEMRERIRQYEERIIDLEKELAAAELEKRELIRNQIILMKRALAEEKEKEQFSTGRARTYSCSSSTSAAARLTPRI